jgi:hypothetical protein
MLKIKIKNEKACLVEHRNNGNNIVPTGLCPPLCYQATKTSCLRHLKGDKLVGGNKKRCCGMNKKVA